ncbi:MAG TPA: hypothetical protein VF720_06540 [Candidatus Eisenbacteria bacterium]
MQRKALLGVGLVAVGAIVFFVLRNYPPVTNGTEGTIGAAKRYQTEQIKAADVQLGDASVNDVLQSGMFHKMMTNEDFRKLVMSDGFRNAAADDGFSRMVADAGARNVLNSGDVQRAAAPEGDLGKLLASDAALLVTTADGQRLIADDSFNKVLADAGARATLQDALGRRFAEAGKWAASDAGKRQIEAARSAAIESNKSMAEAGRVSMGDASKQAVEAGKVSMADAGKASMSDASKQTVEAAKVSMTDAGKVSMSDAGKTSVEAARMTMSDAGKVAAEAERRVMEAARMATIDGGKLGADADLAKAIKLNPELGKLVASDAFKNLASTGKLGTVLGDDGLARAARSQDVAALVARPEVARVMVEYGKYLPELGKTGRVPELGRMMSDASFVQAFSDPGFGKSLAAVDGSRLNVMAEQMARNVHE